MDIEPELQKRLSDSLDYVGKWLQEAEGLAREQVPLVINEMLAWGWWKAFVWIVSLAFLFATTALFAWMVGKQECKKDEEREAQVALCVGSMIVMAFIGCFIVSHAFVMIQITVAPRVYLLNQLGILK